MGDTSFICALSPTQTRGASTSARSTPNRKSRARTRAGGEPAGVLSPQSPGGGAGYSDLPARYDADGATLRSGRQSASAAKPSRSRKASILSRQSYGMFCGSDTGTLVYRAGAGATKLLGTWFDQTGNAGTVPSAIQAITRPQPCRRMGRASPWPAARRRSRHLDRRRGARHDYSASLSIPQMRQPCLVAGRQEHRLFASNRQGQTQLYIKPADGPGEERLMTDQPGFPQAGRGRSLPAVHEQ